MSDFEYKDYFDSRFCFHGDENKVVAILDFYTQNHVDLSDINRVFELYHTKLFFEKVSTIPEWTEEKYKQYKEKTLKLKEVVHKFFKQITEDNIIDIYENCYYSFRDDFRNFFYMFKTYTCISKDKICEILKGLAWNPFHILEDKAFVEYFDEEITRLLEEPYMGVRFVVSHYLEEHDNYQKVYVPKSFTVEKRVKLIENYLREDNVNSNMLQLIIYARNNKELPITPKMKKLAEQRHTDFWENNKTTHIHTHSFCVSFGSYEKEKNNRVENEQWILEYGIDWIKSNTDYPTILNNFIYLFEYTDIQMRCSYISNSYSKSPIIDIFSVKGKGMYKKSVAFDEMDSLADIQMSGYINELKKLDINIESVIKWFFETYLCEEFGVKNFKCNMPDPADSILSKCKTLASAIDGVLSKYKMLCEDGEIDEDLFRYITDSPRIKDVPSLVKNKYCYVKNADLFKEMNMFFSTQSMLGYTEKTGSKYDTFFGLITNEIIKLSECQPYNLEAVKWLSERNVIYLESDIIKFNVERVYILKEFYEKEVISLQHVDSLLLKELIKSGDVSVDNKLLTKPEYQYFNYLLNNSEFGNGKAIRNRYIHDSIIPDEKTMRADYYTLLKVMVILIIKINDDFCINGKMKKEGDFYEL